MSKKDGSFEMNELIVVVNHKKFFEDIKLGKFFYARICQISPTKPGSDDCSTLYRAKDSNGMIYGAYDRNVNASPYEFISLEYLREILARNASDALMSYQLINDWLKELNVTIKEEAKKE